jgi:hypothetical protein
MSIDFSEGCEEICRQFHRQIQTIEWGLLLVSRLQPVNRKSA